MICIVLKAFLSVILVLYKKITMVHTFSIQLPMGIIAPEFQLIDLVSGEIKTLAVLKSDVATVIMFICNHCPYVKHINGGIAKLANDYLQKGIAFVAISANDADAFPDDGPEFLKEQALKHNFWFPYLFDSTQAVAKAYRAACTPDFYVFDQHLELVYHGQMDSSRPKNNEPNDGKDLRDVLDKIIKGQPLKNEQLPSSGYNVKWEAEVSPF